MQKDKSFQNTIHNSFEYFINLNQRSAEFLSLYIDELLRKGFRSNAVTVDSPSSAASKSEDDIDRMLDRVMALFRFLQVLEH